MPHPIESAQRKDTKKHERHADKVRKELCEWNFKEHGPERHERLETQKYAAIPAAISILKSMGTDRTANTTSDRFIEVN